MFIEIYSKVGCPNCDKAKELLDSKQVEYKEYVVGQDITRADTIAKFPRAKVVPIVVVDGQVTEHWALPQLLNE